ncbi:hypothetical protein FM996_19260 [Methylosinus sporium]|uniref:Uncharacterized protein n=1 Tax=Methylosinus sporium TaxID=428 RepID=A0A549SDS2_METSR|nr:hypothetical protein [Methylosinus sporium]TRL26620.1 hypothetical protein FM996_19260 [Methylosinus sporium]
MIGVDPHAQIVEIEMAGRCIGERGGAGEAGRARLREAGEGGYAIGETSAVVMDGDGFLDAVDLAIAVEIERENSVVIGDPSGLMQLAVAERSQARRRRRCSQACCCDAQNVARRHGTPLDACRWFARRRHAGNHYGSVATEQIDHVDNSLTASATAERRPWWCRGPE